MILLPQPPKELGLQAPTTMPANFYIFSRDRVGQAGCELLTSGDPSALASQSAGITGLSHHARPSLLTFISPGPVYCLAHSRDSIVEMYICVHE